LTNLAFEIKLKLMTLKEFGNSLENTPIWKEGLINIIFGLLPIFLVGLLLITFWVNPKVGSKFWKRLVYGVSVVLASLLLLGIWGSSYERFDLKVKTQQVNLRFKAKVALFSDIHIGRFKDKTWVDKVILETNKIENLDAVLVAGDWTYWPKDISKEGFMNDFSALKKSRYPIYAVMGNHDIEKPGPRLRSELEVALVELGVNFVDDKYIDFPTWRLVGVEDLWSDKYVGLVETNLSKFKPNIVLTHQPDVVRDYNKLKTKPVLTLTGHTHCGQVRIPFLYKLALPTIDAFFDKGWYDFEGNNLFISCGVGEVGLPIRLFNLPVVDVLEVN
jgi:uncharacterized protein